MACTSRPMPARRGRTSVSTTRSTSGASRSILVTYLVPALALGYGAVFLGEPVTAAAVAGLALVLTGVGLGTGALGLPRRLAARLASEP